LCCKCLNGSCEAIFDIYASRPFQWYKKHLKVRCFDPCNRVLNFWESQRTPKSPFQECECHLHTPSKWGCDNNHHWVLLPIGTFTSGRNIVWPHAMIWRGHTFRREFMWHVLYGIESMISWLGKKKEGMCNANSFKKTIGSMNIKKIHNGTTIM
jgi:hypothetical protein